MKITILLLFVLCSVSVSGQKKQREADDQKRIELINESFQLMKLDTSRDNQGRFVLSSIITAKDKGLTKDQIFEIVKFTIYKHFGSGDKVIEYENKQEGKIYCRARTMEYPYYNMIQKNGGSFSYEITGLCKDGKAKISISNITHLSGDMGQMRDGSDLGDYFPSAWLKVGKSQTMDQWPKIKNMAYLDLISTIGLFQTAIQEATSKKEEF